MHKYLQAHPLQCWHLVVMETESYEMQVVVKFSMWRWQADLTIVCYYVSLHAEEKCENIVNF